MQIWQLSLLLDTLSPFGSFFTNPDYLTNEDHSHPQTFDNKQILRNKKEQNDKVETTIMTEK